MITSKCSGEESPGGSGPRTPSAAPKRLAVLIIDDNLEYADSLRYLLELYGHHADYATDGPSGVRLASAGLYDAIICDIGLPGIDGYEVARRLRGERATSGATIIAVTGYGSAEAKRQCFAAGFDDHLVKPASVTDILSRLVFGYLIRPCDTHTVTARLPRCGISCPAGDGMFARRALKGACD